MKNEIFRSISDKRSHAEACFFLPQTSNGYSEDKIFTITQRLEEKATCKVAGGIIQVASDPARQVVFLKGQDLMLVMELRKTIR